MSDLEFHPASIDRFSDLVTFFEQHGNPNYCWCMRWRLKSADFQRMKSSERRDKLQSLVQNNIPIGVMAYSQSRVVGWCSVAPRETYPLLEGSTTLKRIDNLPVWSVACFFVSPTLRGQNLPVSLLQAAAQRIAHAKSVSIFEDLGTQMNQHSTLNSYLQRLLATVTGNYGKEGAANAYVPFFSLAKASKGETGGSSKKAGFLF